MKRCPVCRRTYPDDAQNFCLDDGATLVSSASSPNPIPFDNRQAPTVPMYPRSTAGADRAYQPTRPPFSAPLAAAQQKSMLPWILGIALVMVAGVIVTIVLLNGRSSSSSRSEPAKVDVNINTPSSPSTSTSTTSSGSWQTVSGDQFTVMMPGSPAKSEQTEPSPAGPIPMYLYTYSQGYEGYFAGYSVYPDLVFASGNNDAIMNGARDGMIKNLDGTVTNERDITTAGYPGKEFIASSTSKNLSIVVHLYIAKPRMYILMYTQYGAGQTISADGSRFLDSFQITK